MAKISSRIMGAVMTQIDEPDKLQELFENYHIVKYDNIDGYTRLADSESDWYELYTSIKALIANQVREELTNLKIARLNLGTITTDHADGYQMAVDDMNRHIDNRIKELKGN